MYIINGLFIAIYVCFISVIYCPITISINRLKFAVNVSMIPGASPRPVCGNSYSSGCGMC